MLGSLNDKVLIVSPTPTHPPTAGNRMRVLKLLEEMDLLGVAWHFVVVRMEVDADEEATRAHWGYDRCEFVDADCRQPRRGFLRKVLDKCLRWLGRPRCLWSYGVDDWCGPRLMSRVSEIRDRICPKVVWIEYVFLSRLFELFPPKVFKVLDTHDVFAGRHRMMRAQGKEPEWFFTTAKEEGKGCRRADLVVAIQEKEREHISGNYKVESQTIGHFVDIRPTISSAVDYPVLAFIGSGNPVNLDGIEWFVREIWPNILAKVPAARLEVYGESGRPFAGREIPGVDIMGQVESLDSAYERAWVVVAPLRMGTGLKIKSMEALGRGKALVATYPGVEGMDDGKNIAYLHADGADGFARECIRLLNDSHLRERFEQAGVSYAESWNSKYRRTLESLIFEHMFHG